MGNDAASAVLVLRLKRDILSSVGEIRKAAKEEAQE